MRHRCRWRGAAAAGAAALALSVPAGCGSEGSGTPVLNWYINPDSGGQEEIAARCSTDSDGAYRIEVSVLPREASEQRQQLIRRLAANDSSIDLMSLDPPYVPEFAEAGFLAPVPDDVGEQATEGVVEPAVQGATWREELVALPFWANTQLLWYRKDAVEATGLDMSRPVTWQQVIDAARDADKQVAAQGRRAESLTVWLNALIESAGGSIITDPSVENPEAIELGLDDDRSVDAAEVIRELTGAGVSGPAFSTASEDVNATSFESGDAIFMVNWPFVWTRAQAGAEDGSLEAEVPDDYGWALYPQVSEDEPSAPPLGGIDIGVGAFSDHTEEAYEAAQCITSADNQADYMVSDGNPAANSAAYEDPEVLEAFPMAPTILESLEQAAPRPQTAYYAEVSESLQRAYHPPAGVDPERVGSEAAALIRGVLAKEDLL